MKIIWSPFAHKRIIEIAEYIANDNPRAAEKWVNSIFDAVKRLKDFPQSGRLVPEADSKDVREILFGNYRIIDRIEVETVKILTVRQGRQILPLKDLSNE